MRRDLTHEHEWCLEPRVEWDEDVFVTFDCEYVEITGSVTSDRLDETFYEEGAECLATKTLVYDLWIEHDTEKRFGSAQSEIVEDGEPYEHLWMNHAGTVEDEMRRVDPRDPMVGTSIDGETVGLGENYCVILELHNERVEEDWG